MIDFYEGPNATQTKHCTLSDTSGQAYDLKSKGTPCVNDDITSVKFNNARVGTIVTLFDDRKGNPNKDDYTVIKVLKATPEIVVGHLEQSYSNEFVDVAHSHDNGLNGKVSHIRIE